jgi:replication factor A1
MSISSEPNHAGAIQQIFSSSSMHEVGKAQILQVLDVTRVEGDRYRLVLSDGESVAQAMLASSLNHLVITGQITEKIMLSLDEYVCSMVNDMRIIIVLRVHAVDEMPVMSVPPPASDAFIPIRSLSISSSYRSWSIKCRVILKTTMRTWKNERGEGHCFSVDLIDRYSDTIRATIFNAVADQLYDVVQSNRVYIISSARIQVSSKKYNPLSHHYQLTIEHANQMVPDTNTTNVPDTSIPMQQFTFMKINMIASTMSEPAGQMIDVIGVVIVMQPIITVRTHEHHGIRKRQLTVMDETGHIDLTLWANNADVTTAANCPFVICIKNANVTEFDDQTMIATTAQSQVLVDPLMEQAESLKRWYTTSATAITATSLSSLSSSSSSSPLASRTDWSSPTQLAQRTTLGSITEKRLGQDKVDWITVRITIINVGHDINNLPYYPSCPVCTKKVIQSSDTAGWFCDACNQSYLTPRPRYVLQVQCADASGTRWITAFDGVATKILAGTTATDLVAMRQRNDLTNYQRVLQGAINRQFFFRVRLKCSDVIVASRSSSVAALAIDVVETQYDIDNDRP